MALVGTNLLFTVSTVATFIFSVLLRSLNKGASGRAMAQLFFGVSTVFVFSPRVIYLLVRFVGVYLYFRWGYCGGATKVYVFYHGGTTLRVSTSLLRSTFQHVIDFNT